MIRVAPLHGGRVMVTFTAPANGLVGPLAVVGDFNDWDPAANPLTRDGNTYLAALPVHTGRRYAYRYLAAGRHHFNDEAADDYQPNPHGGLDSVLDLTHHHAGAIPGAIPSRRAGG
jgi:1,4-alpha-glucan branching enzyme